MRLEQLERRLALSVTFVETDQILGNPYTRDVAVGDLDDDGKIDVLLANNLERTVETWLNVGNAEFVHVDQAIGDGGASRVALGDLDGDGDLDAFVAIARGVSAAENWDRVFLNDGFGGFTDSGQQLSEYDDGSGPLDSLSVVLGDLDGDGDLDAVTGRGHFDLRSPGLLGVWSNDGSGLFAFTFEALVVGTSGTTVWSAVLGDLDGDGDLDSYAATQGIAPMDSVWLNDGHGMFVDSGTKPDSGRDTYDVELGDVDGDGDIDAIVAHSATPSKVLLNDGTGRLSDSGQTLPDGVSVVALEDIELDGDVDVFLGRRRDVPNEIWLNDGDGVFLDSGLRLSVPDADGTNAVSFGDLDNDGDSDLVLVSDFSGASIWINESLRSEFAAGDANRDHRFDQRDIIQVLQAGKYGTGEPADWSQGDWNGDGVFNQLDIVVALQAGNYLQ